MSPFGLNNQRVDQDAVRDLDMRKRRVRNASPSALPGDYVIQAELINLGNVVNKSIQQAVANIHANLQSYTQATLPPSKNFNAGDLVWVSDYNHFLINVSGAWVRVLPNLYVQNFLAAPDPANGWHLCDGTAGVSYLKKDGSLGTITVPNVPFYSKSAAAYNGPGITAAVLPGVDNPATTASGAAVIGGPSSTTNVSVTTTTQAVASSTHTHTDSGHTHVIADPTVTLPGDPIANISFLAYVRL